ncbi:glycoside hydrolase family 10 protein [Priestia megaterium]|uniref:glycoside hydrolase family 10 protein n=1 Tax=Priestia megaterium TaxID=1404 RepID=UPI0022B93E77|nr:family 10 glycosylhydrolase [Priestia megaterium]MCZ8495545.1 family 10 glycosylhydrolase [Priestia megaterium]
MGHAQTYSQKDSQQTSYLKHELRATWVASVLNIDWPSKPGLSIAQQKSEFINYLEEQKRMGMNAIVMQIKPTADAFYPSKYGLWSEYLTGNQGKDPGYNPLSFMVKEAHKRNMEFHAWFNPYRITMPLGKEAALSDLDKLPENHPARKHPEWVVPYGQQLYFNPGIPEVQKFVIDGIMEVVKNYDIDAVHMDDYFYPYKIAGKTFPDQEAYQRYGANKFNNIEDWRRDNVNNLVKNINKSIKEEKSYVKFGISPFGVWRNKAVDPTGSETTAGQTNYDDLYADTRTWINNGYVDYIAPQLYWNIGLPVADYAKLLAWWTKEVEGKNVQLYIGQADYKINTNSNGVQNWFNPEELPNQIKLNRTYNNFKGSMHFSAKDLKNNPLGIADRLTEDIYKQPALVPPMPWIDNEAPKKPKVLQIKKKLGETKFKIRENNPEEVAYYAIYRFEGNRVGNINDSKYLLTTVRKEHNNQVYVDPTSEKGETYTYVVTSLDRNHNESKPSNPIKVEKK